MDWSFDMSKAPRGKYRVIPSGPNAKGARRVFERAEIIAASACGIVTVSYFIPEERRFNMFTADSGPIAWMPYDGRKMTGKGATPPAHPTMAESWVQRALRERVAA